MIPQFEAEATKAGVRDTVIILSLPSQSALMIMQHALRLTSCGTLVEVRVSTILLSVCNDQH